MYRKGHQDSSVLPNLMTLILLPGPMWWLRENRLPQVLVFHTYGIVCICCVCSAQFSDQPVYHCDTTVTKHLVCFAEVSAADNNSNLIEPAAEVKPKNFCVIVTLGKTGNWAGLSVLLESL